MGGLALGFIGGLVASIASVVGTLFIFMRSYFNKDSLFKLRLDFLIGFLLIIAAVNIVNPLTIEKSTNLSINAFFLGVLFLILSTKLLKIILAGIAINNLDEQKAIFFILMSLLKNIPIGLAAGAAMNLSHTGEGNSLLTGLAVHNLFNGTAVAFCFLSLGVNSSMAIMGAMGISILTIVTSLLGGYLCQENTHFLSLIMTFAGGTLVGTSLLEIFIIVNRESKKILLDPKFVSALVVMLIFIVW